MAASRLKPKAGEPNQSQGKKERMGKGAVQSATTKHCEKHDTTFVVDCCVIADFGSDSEDDDCGKKKVTIHYGKELNRHREFNAIIINLTPLLITMHEMNDTSKPCLTQIRAIEH